MPRWIHAAYIAVWAVTAIVFACLAYSSYASTSTSLERLAVSPTGADIDMGGLSITKTLLSLAEVNNRNVTALEESIHSTAWLSFWLNTVSSLAAMLGCIAQFGQYRHDQSRNS